MKFTKVFAVFIPILFISLTSVTPANATGDWEMAKSGTGIIKDAAVEAATTALALAGANLIAAQATLVAANAALAAAAGTASGVALASAAVMQAEAAVVVAAAGVTTAAAILKGVVVASLCVVAGVGIAQLGWGAWDFCWDPVCHATSLTTISPIYHPISQSEIDLLIPQLLFEMDGETYTKEDVMYSEVGIIAWEYMSLQVGTFVNAARGAAAHTQGRHAEVLNAVEDLNVQLKALPEKHLQLADALENTPVIPASTLNELKSASLKVDEAIQILDELDLPFDAEERIAVMEGKNAIDKSILAIAELYDSKGNPRTLVGDEGIFPTFSHTAFLDFIQDCKDNGKECLPESEIRIGMAMLNTAGVNFQPDFFEELAKLDSQPGGYEEEALFRSSESITISDVLRTYGTDLSNSGMWLNIDLEQSPLTIEARSALTQDDGSLKTIAMMILILSIFIIIALFVRSRRSSL